MKAAAVVNVDEITRERGARDMQRRGFGEVIRFLNIGRKAKME
jgi:hypothetical protein